MSKLQYNIPGYDSELASARDNLAVISNSPNNLDLGSQDNSHNPYEASPAYPVSANPEIGIPTYEAIKRLEDQIDSCRKTALEVQSLKAPSLLDRLVKNPSETTMADLIELEKESTAGLFFGPGSYFWLDAKDPSRPNNSYYSQNDVADWYYMQPNPGSIGGQIILRFQTTPRSIYKLYNGVEYPLSVQELGAFCRAAELYVEKMLQLPEYAIDGTLAEIRSEIMAEQKIDYEQQGHQSYGSGYAGQELPVSPIPPSDSRDNYSLAA